MWIPYACISTIRAARPWHYKSSWLKWVSNWTLAEREELVLLHRLRLHSVSVREFSLFPLRMYLGHWSLLCLRHLSTHLSVNTQLWVPSGTLYTAWKDQRQPLISLWLVQTYKETHHQGSSRWNLSLTFKAMVFFFMSNFLPYRLPKKQHSDRAVQMAIMGQAAEAGHLNLTLALPFVHCFDMRMLFNLPNIHL